MMSSFSVPLVPLYAPMQTEPLDLYIGDQSGPRPTYRPNTRSISTQTDPWPLRCYLCVKDFNNKDLLMMINYKAYICADCYVLKIRRYDWKRFRTERMYRYGSFGNPIPMNRTPVLPIHPIPIQPMPMRPTLPRFNPRTCAQSKIRTPGRRLTHRQYPTCCMRCYVSTYVP